ncbi:MAG: ParB/RepB/Spo0J family partition protein [Bacillota bacterium]
MKKGLGKGLSALFEDTNSEYEGAGVKTEYVEKSSEIAVSEIHPNPNQPRKIFDEDALEELKNSIVTHGVISPIIVTKDDSGYLIVAGERRYRACVLAGLRTMPVIVKDYSPKKIAEIALIENLQREDLNVVESAQGISELMQKYSLTQQEISARLGKSRSNIANILRILQLPNMVISYVQSGALSFGHGKALAGIENKELCEIIAREALDKNMSVRDLEKKIQSVTKNNVGENEYVKKEKKPVVPDENIREFERLLTRKFASKVSITGDQAKGKIVIEYFTKDDLERYYDILIGE